MMKEKNTKVQLRCLEQRTHSVENQAKTLNVPTIRTTILRTAPAEVFQLSTQQRTGVYILNHCEISGVVLAQDLYENLLEELEDLRFKQKMSQL